MLLRLQPEESIQSFIARNIYIGCGAGNVQFLQRIYNSQINTGMIKALASILGWKGCEGFNKLLHYHTDYSVWAVFQDLSDHSYSGKNYILNTRSLGFQGGSIGFCPNCYLEDIRNLGYAYWRRLHSNGARVCSRHNVVLITNCPFCDKEFSHHNHDARVMWSGCGGRYFHECIAQKNSDVLGFRRAQFSELITNAKFQLCEQTSMNFLCSMLASSGLPFIVRADASTTPADIVIAELSRHRKLGSGKYSSNGYSTLPFDVLVNIYSRFECFIKDLARVGCEFRDVSFGWATYRAGGFESPNFVRENCRFGVGEWFCPVPSRTSQSSFSADGRWRRQPRIYPCCNSLSGSGEDHRLRSGKAIKSPPAVPFSREIQ